MSAAAHPPICSWSASGTRAPSTEDPTQRRGRGRRAPRRRRHGAKLRKGKERALADEVTDRGRLRARDPAHLHERLGGEAVRLLHAATAWSRPRCGGAGRARPPDRDTQAQGRGGLAGHNGLRSIKAHLHSDEFLRVRIGVSKPQTKEQGADHVLNKFGEARADRDRRDDRAGRRRGGGHRSATASPWR